MDDSRYQGSELETFVIAENWRKYIGKIISPFIHKRVVEVGAGIGSFASALISANQSWTLLEPDCSMAEKLRKKFHSTPNVLVVNGRLSELNSGKCFDTILYMDVLEHIEDDESELELAANHLSPQGHLIILAPAFNFLYSKFDKSIGHHRRYSKSALRRAIPSMLDERKLHYVDSLGYFLLLGNKLLLNQSYPNKKHVWTWDRFLLPVSRFADPVFRNYFGKSILGIWKKN